MRAIRKSSKSCGSPDFSCVSVVNSTRVPKPRSTEILIRVAGSGINPDEISLLQIPLLEYTLGLDVAGVVVAVGEVIQYVEP